MKTPLTIERRLARLEARVPTECSASRRNSLPPLSPDAFRIVLAMLVEMGALMPPPLSQPDRLQGLRLALFRSEPLVSDDDPALERATSR